MALYKFQISDSAGNVREQVIEGDSVEDAIRRIRLRQLLPLEFRGEVANERGNVFRHHFDVYSFTNRLVPLINAHVPLERALGIMMEGIEKAEEREVIVSLRKGLHEGKSFSELIRTQGNRFPRIYANLIEAGEESGCLELVMGNLQRFINESKEQKDFLITSSIYPAIILSITFIVLILVFGVFIPRFSQIFIDMGKALPWPTQIMLTISRIINFLWPLWLALLLGVIWLVIRIKKGGREREWFDRNIIKAPILGPMLVTVEISRFIRTLSILIGNHVHLLKSIQISVKVISNHTIALTMGSISADLRGGAKLSDTLKRSQYVPPGVIQMLKVGEESGEVGEMLEKVAVEMEKNVKTEIKRLLALFEPAVIVMMALVILVVIISIFLAVIEMNNV